MDFLVIFSWFVHKHYCVDNQFMDGSYIYIIYLYMMVHPSLGIRFRATSNYLFKATGSIYTILYFTDMSFKPKGSRSEARVLNIFYVKNILLRRIFKNI